MEFRKGTRPEKTPKNIHKQPMQKNTEKFSNRELEELMGRWKPTGGTRRFTNIQK